MRCVDVDEKLAREQKIRNEKEAKKRNNLLYPAHLTHAKSNEENDENKNIFNRNVSKSLDDSYNYQNIQRFQSDNKKIKDLPQVITIRFI